MTETLVESPVALASDDRQRVKLDAVVAFGCSLAVYGLVAGVVLRPYTVELLLDVARGDLMTGRYAAYKLFLAGVHAVMSVAGASLHQTATALSMVVTALAVAVTNAACRRADLSRPDSWLVTALVGSCPAVVFFATQPGPPAIALAAAALALAALARCVRSGRLRSAVAAGVWAAAAAAVDVGGALLPLVAAAIVVIAKLGDGPSVRGRAAWITAASVFGLAAPLVFIAFVPPLRDAFAKGWLRAFFPLSVLWLVGFLREPTRRLAVVLAVALVPCVGLASVLAADSANEGGHLLLLVVPLVWLAHRTVSRNVLAATALLGLVVGFARVGAHDTSNRAALFGGGLQEIVHEAATTLIVRDVDEAGLVLMGASTVEQVTLTRFVEAFEGLAEKEFYGRPIEEELEAAVVNLFAQGFRVFLTQGAEDLLRNPGYRVRHHVAVRIFDCLRERFDLVQVEARGFRAKELRLK